MQVIVNGEKRVLSKECSLADALQEWGYKSDMPIAVAVNNKVIPKQNHATLMLAVDHVIEILMPMQGG